MVPILPNNSSKKLRLRPSVGVLSLTGSIDAISSLPVRLTATTLPAGSKRTWSTVWSITRGPRKATVVVSRDDIIPVVGVELAGEGRPAERLGDRILIVDADLDRRGQLLVDDRAAMLANAGAARQQGRARAPPSLP